MTQFCVLRSLCQVQLAHQVIPLTMGWAACSRRTRTGKHVGCRGFMPQPVWTECAHAWGGGWSSERQTQPGVGFLQGVQSISSEGSPESHSQWWLWSHLLRWRQTSVALDGVGVGGALFGQPGRRGKLCVLSSGSHDHNLTKADAVCSRNY